MWGARGGWLAFHFGLQYSFMVTLPRGACALRGPNMTGLLALCLATWCLGGDWFHGDEG
jgi:hypothetical protein